MSFFKNAYWALPHDVRRSIYKRVHGQAYQALNALRDAPIERDNSVSFRPFIENRCIFVHIPKCAGISISHSLFGFNAGTHKTIKEYQIAFNAKEFNAFYKFTIVRNPWDRLLSAYRFLMLGGRNGFDKRWSETHLAKYPDFRAFVLNGLSEDEVLRWQHFRPQSDFLVDGAGNMPMDFIGRFETLDEDFQTIAKKLGKSVSLQVANKTAGEKVRYKDAYDDEMMKRVAEVYQDDIRLLNYQF